MITRRKFIETTTLATLAGLTVPNLLFAETYRKTPYGLILYTVREEMKKDPIKTLEKIAQIGYKVIEAAGYNQRLFYGMKPSKFKEVVNSFGMKLISSHTGISDKNLNEVIEDTAEAGLKYVIHPWMKTGNADVYKKAAEEYNKFGEAFKKAGIQFGYHNHAFEFEKNDGKAFYDILLKETDPDLVIMELDLYWITFAGSNPLEYFKKYPGRFELWHVKDMKNNADKAMTEVGNGSIDFDKIFKNKKQSGMKYYFVEQDKCFDYPSVESIEISLKHIKEKNYK